MSPSEVFWTWSRIIAGCHSQRRSYGWYGGAPQFAPRAAAFAGGGPARSDRLRVVATEGPMPAALALDVLAGARRTFDERSRTLHAAACHTAMAQGYLTVAQ